MDTNGRECNAFGPRMDAEEMVVSDREWTRINANKDVVLDREWTPINANGSG